jgi:uncharacterized membrane protein YgcG
MKWGRWVYAAWCAGVLVYLWIANQSGYSPFSSSTGSHGGGTGHGGGGRSFYHK